MEMHCSGQPANPLLGFSSLPTRPLALDSPLLTLPGLSLSLTTLHIRDPIPWTRLGGMQNLGLSCGCHTCPVCGSALQDQAVHRAFIRAEEKRQGCGVLEVTHVTFTHISLAGTQQSPAQGEA